MVRSRVRLDLCLLPRPLNPTTTSLSILLYSVLLPCTVGMRRDVRVLLVGDGKLSLRPIALFADLSIGQRELERARL